MKNKIKPILFVLIIFGAILGLNNYTNAAENLKILQEKYKISYNNLTKALKEGADQEHIDKLSAQCKEDYAEYQKAAKDSGGFENKTNIQPVKPNSDSKKNEPAFEAPVPMIQFKQLKIKVNGKDKLVNVPFINQAFAKKNPPDKRPVRIKEKPAPRRIGGAKKGTKFKKSGKYYEVPCSYEVFGYPIDDTDKFRIDGEEKIYELYCLVAAQTVDNYSDSIVKIMTLQYEIMEKYGKYPDICAAAQLYGTDSFEKYAKDAGFFKYFYSTSTSYFRYSQLGIQYEHLKGSNEAMKTILGVFEDRKKEIKANNQALIEQNKEYEKAIKTYTLELKNIKDAVHGKPSEQSMNGFASEIANKYSAICYSYSQIYNNLMQANEKEEADSILKIVKNGEEYKLSGKLYDIYSEVPPELPFKYSYTACAPANNPTKLPPTRDCPYGEITTSGEVKVKMYRDADKLLQIVRDARSSQTLDKEDTIEIDGRSRNERRTIELCDYLNNFIPSTGDEAKKIAPEKISKESLDQYKELAYNNTGTPEYNDFYKRKPYIKELYFARNEDVKLSESEILSPQEFVTVRAKTDYEQPLTPDYAFVGRAYTVKQPQLSEEEPLPAVIKIEPEIGRQKKVALIPDSLSYGYYARFKMNETDLNDETPQLPSTGPIISLKNVSKNEAVNKNIVNTTTDAFRESISFIHNSYIKNLINKTFYKTNTYFNNQQNTNNRNIFGFFNNYYTELNNLIIPYISADMIKCGGMQYSYFEIDIFAKSYTHNKKNKLTCNIMVRNQADWLIVDSHGGTADGAIVIAKPDETNPGHDKEMFRVRPWELLKNINKPNEYSEYAEDIDVLFLFTCFSLKWIDSNPFSQTPQGYIYAKGWHKVLPKGIVFGFMDYAHGRLSQKIVFSLNTFIDNKPQMNKNETQNKLREFWRHVNEGYYSEGKKNPVITDENGENVKNFLLYTESAAILLKKYHISYDIVPIEVNKIVVRYEFKENIKTFNEVR